MSRFVIVEGNSNDKDNVRVIMVKGEKGDTGDPTKLSQLENDVGYITREEANLQNYYNKSEIDATVEELNDTIDEKADTSDIEIEINDINNSLDTTNNELTEFKNTTNATLSSQDSRIDSLASGSPLVASSVSGMTDTTRTYVNTTDGNWYYYNGSNWIIGGVYQAEQLSSQNQDLINSVTAFNNLFNGKYDLALPNLGFITADGSFDGRDTSSYYTSEYLYINLIKDLDMSSYISSSATVRLYNFYDIDKTFLGRSNIFDDYTYYSDAVFVRICRHKSYDNPIVNNELSKLQVNTIYRDYGLQDYDGGIKSGAYVYGVYNENDTRLCSQNYIKVIKQKYVVQVAEGYKITIQFFDKDLNYINFINYAQNLSFTPNDNVEYIVFNIKKDDSSTFPVSEYENVNLQITKYSANNKDLLVKDIIPFVGRWNGKKINYIGDSISAGHNIGSEYAWPVICSQILGAEYTNYAISGSTIGDYNNLGEHTPISERYTEMSDNADLIVVLGGRNDYREVPMPIGTKGDTDNSTFYGAMKTLLDGLWEKYPTKTIVFITTYKAMVKTTPIKQDNVWTNSAGNIQEDYNNVIKEMCKDYSIPVIDLYNDGIINSWNESTRSYYFIDTVHPSIEGCKFLGEIIASRLNSI